MLKRRKNMTHKSFIDRTKEWIMDFFASISMQFTRTDNLGVANFFKFLILAAGAWRVFDLMNKVGQGFALSMFGILYSEGGFLFWEFLDAKAYVVDKKDKKGATYTPIINQRNIAVIGTWVHIISSVLFTISDFVQRALEGSSINFIFLIGGTLGVAALVDVSLLWLYRFIDPRIEIERLRRQLVHQKQVHQNEMSLLASEKAMGWERENIGPLAELDAKIAVANALTNKYSNINIDAALEMLENALRNGAGERQDVVPQLRSKATPAAPNTIPNAVPNAPSIPGAPIPALGFETKVPTKIVAVDPEIPNASEGEGNFS
jgi:hypothetical protein